MNMSTSLELKTPRETYAIAGSILKGGRQPVLHSYASDKVAGHEMF